MSEKIVHCTAERGIYQGPNQRTGPRQRGGNPERAAGEGGGVSDAGGALRAQRGPSGLPQWPLCALKRLKKAPLFDGKTFWQVEQEIEWVDC